MYWLTIWLNKSQLCLLYSWHKYKTSNYTISILHSNNYPNEGEVLSKSEWINSFT